MSDHKITFSFTFEVELDGEDAYVIERQEGEPSYRRYGPMPRDAAGPLIDELKEHLQDTLDRLFEEKRK